MFCFFKIYFLVFLPLFRFDSSFTGSEVGEREVGGDGKDWDSNSGHLQHNVFLFFYFFSDRQGNQVNAKINK